MNEDFEKFKQWLKLNYEEGFEDLNPPATDEEIQSLKIALDFDLPKDLIDILKIHNGQKGDAGYLFDGQEFLSSNRIISEWKVWKDLLDNGSFNGSYSEPQEGIKNDWWNKKWIPYTHNGSGDHYCIDMDPSENGTSGQIITMWHDDDQRDLLSSSLSEWFKSYVEGLYSGQYIYTDEYESIMNKEDI